MKVIRTVGLYLAAMFVLGAMAASSASATGLLLARVAGGGNIAGVSFLSLSEAVLLTLHNGSDIKCAHVHSNGLFLSPTLGNFLIRLESCSVETEIGPSECISSGEPIGDIHLPLATTFFHLGLAHFSNTVGKIPAVAILLAKDVEFSCASFGAAEILMLGSVIGALQLDPSKKQIPLNQSFANAILNFEETAFGLQHLRLLLFEGTLHTYDLDTIVTTFGTSGPVELSAEVALALLDLFTLNGGKHVELELFED